MLRIVIDTNIWIRILLRGRVTLPVLTTLQSDKIKLLISQPLLDEYDTVWQRPRLRKSIDPLQAARVRRQINSRAEMIKLKTIPPGCRDPKDQPVLATAIDGKADAIVTGDSDLRADDELRKAMANYGVQLWGVQSLIDALND